MRRIAILILLAASMPIVSYTSNPQPQLGVCPIMECQFDIQIIGSADGTYWITNCDGRDWKVYCFTIRNGCIYWECKEPIIAATEADKNPDSRVIPPFQKR